MRMPCLYDEHLEEQSWGRWGVGDHACVAKCCATFAGTLMLSAASWEIIRKLLIWGKPNYGPQYTSYRKLAARIGHAVCVCLVSVPNKGQMLPVKAIFSTLHQ